MTKTQALRIARNAIAMNPHSRALKVLAAEVRRLQKYAPKRNRILKCKPKFTREHSDYLTSAGF